MCPRLSFDRVWPAVRDVASWGLGAWWGTIMALNPPADPWMIQLVAMLLGLPFVFRADEQRRNKRDSDGGEDLRQSSNGHQEHDPERSEP